MSSQGMPTGEFSGIPRNDRGAAIDSCLTPGPHYDPGGIDEARRPALAGPHPCRAWPARSFMRARRPALAGPSSPPDRVIRRELSEARRPALAGPQPTGPVTRQELYEGPAPRSRRASTHRASDPAGALLRPGAPLSPGLIPTRIGDPEGAPMRPGAPLSPGLVKQDARPGDEVHIPGAGFCGLFLYRPGRAPSRAVSRPLTSSPTGWHTMAGRAPGSPSGR